MSRRRTRPREAHAKSQRLAQRTGRNVCFPGPQRLPSFVQQRLEAVLIELARRNPQHIAVGASQQHAVVALASLPPRLFTLEQAAQPRREA